MGAVVWELLEGRLRSEDGSEEEASPFLIGPLDGCLLGNDASAALGAKLCWAMRDSVIRSELM